MVPRRDGWEQGVGGDRRAGALALLAVLGLAACREANRREPASAPAPAGASAGPVNPDAGITSYACIDGQTVTAGYPDATTAVLSYRGHAYTLKLAPSAEGRRYTGYGLQWRVRGRRGALAALKPGEEVASAVGLDCIAGPAPAAAQPATRTAFTRIGPRRQQWPPAVGAGGGRRAE
jgi:membrane-bound inhibitor of C-type lysozyme